MESVAVSRAIRVNLFGRYRELASHPYLVLSLPPDATVTDLVEALHEIAPGRLPARPTIVLNRRVAADGQTIGETDEVALLPPMAGG